MASPTVPVHGKQGAMYRLRPNGFKGAGLNDVTWGTGFTGVASAYYEVEIFAEATPDTFRWRVNGGAWDDNTGAGYAITGAAQTLDDAQTITFAATTGHTVAEKWYIGNLKDEPCDESGATAQITATARRMLNPNTPPTFTDSGGAAVVWIDYASGTAHFDSNVTTVTVTGNDGYSPDGALTKVGYLQDWNMNVEVEMHDMSALGDTWKSALPGLGGGNGGANGFFIGNKSFFEAFEDNVDGTQKYFLLQLFNYDPDQDQTGDHWNVWVTFTSINVNVSIGELVKEGVNFTLNSKPYFVADV